jgi:hypothetical protein
MGIGKDGAGRKAAVSFAEANWNLPGESFWLSNQEIMISQVRHTNVLKAPYWVKAPVADGWVASFQDDGLGGEKAVFRRTVGGVVEEILINPWAGIADCAHFLSKCLTKGGVTVSELVVSKLVKRLQDRSDTKTLCERVSQAGGQRVIDTGIFKPGDMIGYFNIDPKGDYDGREDYAHSTMYVGKDVKKDGGVTCHTICRFPGKSWVEDSWWLHGGYSYTLIHFSDDDPVPDPAAVSTLTGWWQLDYAGRTEYYMIQKADGRAWYTKRAPSKGQTYVHAPEGSAYWFMAPGGDITFTWRKTGTVEVWTPTGGGGYKSMINGTTPGVLTKLP